MRRFGIFPIHRKHIKFSRDYHSPIYWVCDVTRGDCDPPFIPKANIRLIDKSYAHASDIVVEAPSGDKIRLKVAGR